MSRSIVDEIAKRVTALEQAADALDIVFDVRPGTQLDDAKIVDVRERMERLIEHLDTVQVGLDGLMYL